MDKEIHFDTHGLTGECPKYGISGTVTSDVCLQCQYNRGHHGFTTFCDYLPREYTAKGEDMAKDINSMMVITDNPRKSLIVKYRNTGFWLTQRTNDHKLGRTVIMNQAEAKQLVYFILHHILGT